jgi:putative inorganic carbon (hco3(-)) transporter
MRAILGWIILSFTIIWALSRNHRWALFGMIACDNIRPGDEYIGFGMESVRFSISYYIVCYALLLIFSRRYRMTSDRFHWAVLFLFISAVSSGLQAPCYGPAVFQIDVYFKMLMQYYFICALIRNEDEMKELYWAILLCISVVSIRYCFGKFFLWERRFEGATGDRNEMAMTMVMALPFAVMLGMIARERSKKIIAWALVVPLALCTGFSLSRGGMLGFLAVGGYILYRLHHKRWLIVVGVVLSLVALANMPSEIVQRFSTIGGATKTDRSTLGRLNAWDAARAMAHDRPFTGIGVGNFRTYFKRYAPNPNDVHIAHSSIFQLLGEQGYPGLFIWLWLVVMCWVVASWVEIRIVRTERGKWTDARYMIVAAKASWIGYVTCGAFLSQEDMDFFYHLLAIVSRFTVFASEREQFLLNERSMTLQAMTQAPTSSKIL